MVSHTRVSLPKEDCFQKSFSFSTSQYFSVGEPPSVYHVVMFGNTDAKGNGDALMAFHPQFQPNQLLFRSPLSEATILTCDFSSIASFGFCDRSHHLWYSTHHGDQTVFRVNSVTVKHVARLLRKYLEDLAGPLETDDRLDRGSDRVAFRVPGRVSHMWMDVPGVVLRQSTSSSNQNRASCFPELERVLHTRHEFFDIPESEARYISRRIQQGRNPSLPAILLPASPSLSHYQNFLGSPNGRGSPTVTAEDDEVYDLPLAPGAAASHYSEPLYTYGQAALNYSTLENIYDQPEGGRELPQPVEVPYHVSPVHMGSPIDDDDGEYVDMELKGQEENSGSSSIRSSSSTYENLRPESIGSASGAYSISEAVPRRPPTLPRTATVKSPDTADTILPRRPPTLPRAATVKKREEVSVGRPHSLSVPHKSPVRK